MLLADEEMDDIRGRWPVVFPVQTDGEMTMLRPDHELYEPLLFPLQCPRGERGWRTGIRVKDADAGVQLRKRGYVSRREYNVYRMQTRSRRPYHWLARGLSQLHAVDSWIRCEEEHLEYVRQNQKKIRGATMDEIWDALLADAKARNVGTRVYLPANHTGSDRFLHNCFQDCMAIAR